MSVTAFAQGLLTSLTGNKATAMAHDQAGAITTNLGSNADLQSFFTTQAGNGNPNAPKAYLNYVFLDEQFNFVGQSSGAQKVYQPGDGVTPLQAANLLAPRNGYVYVYLSNESVEPVYFDNFTVSHQRSPLIEEGHYYAYGLKIQAISSKAVASTLNPAAVSHGYQGSYAEEVGEFDLGYEEFDLRTYDPQLGRWTGADPFDEFASPYVGMGGDPANNVDPSGGFLGLSGLASAAAQTVAGGLIGGAIDAALGGDGWAGWAKGMAIGSGGAIFSPGTSTLNPAPSTIRSATAISGRLAANGDEHMRGAVLSYERNSNGKEFLKVTSNIFVYSNILSEGCAKEHAEKIQDAIICNWGDPIVSDDYGDLGQIGRQGVPVTFDVKVTAVSYGDAVEIVNTRLDATMSFFSLDESGRSHTQIRDRDPRGGGGLNVQDLIESGYTTAAHEYGHILGYFVSKLDKFGNVLPEGVYGHQTHSWYEHGEEDYIMGAEVSGHPASRRVRGVEYQRVNQGNGFRMPTHKKVSIGNEFFEPPIL